jgi:polyisoprenoid-binding protein YceI
VTAGRGRLELGTRSSIGKADIAKSTVNVTIDVATVDTGVSQRDADLKSDHFFDVEKLPTATFVSKTVSKSPNGLIVSGDLTVRGMTKPVVLQVEGPNGPVNGMDHKPHSGFSAITIINRQDFQIGTNYPAAVLGNEVKSAIDLDLAKQQSCVR